MLLAISSQMIEMVLHMAISSPRMTTGTRRLGLDGMASTRPKSPLVHLLTLFSEVCHLRGLRWAAS
jgi:hypothetical protein